MKIFLLGSLCMLFASAVNAQEIECKPSAESGWASAQIDRLQDGVQNFLYHVKANGSYRVADLICSVEECFGFVNGFRATGKIEFTASRPFKIVSLSLSEENEPVKKFVCK